MPVLTITDKEFDSEVLKSKNIVLVDFYADWCTPCKIISSDLEDLSKEREDIKFCKINVDEYPNSADKYEIRGIPTLIFFYKGDIKNTQVGRQSKENLLKLIDKINAEVAQSG